MEDAREFLVEAVDLEQGRGEHCDLLALRQSGSPHSSQRANPVTVAWATRWAATTWSVDSTLSLDSSAPEARLG